MRKPESKNGERPSLMTVREVAAYLSVHQATIYRLLKDAQIPALKIGSDWRFSQASVDRWVIEQERKISASA